MAIGDLYYNRGVAYDPEVMAALSAPTATASSAPTRQAAWQGKKPTNPKPVKGLKPEDVQLQTVEGIGGLQFVTNKGNIASVREKEAKEKGAAGIANLTGFVPLVEGATYRIRDEKGKDEILYSGIGEEGLRNVYAIAQDLSAKKGKNANWGVEMQVPGTDTWRRVADDDPAKGFLDSALDVLGDAALGFVIGGPIGAAVAGGLSVAGVNVSDIAYPIIAAATPLGPIAGAAVGSGLSSAVQGRSLEDALIRAGLAAGTAGLVEAIPGAKEALGKVTNSIGIGGAMQDGLLPDISGVLSGSIPSQVVGNEIIVTGLGNLPSQAASGAVSGAISGPANALINQPIPGSSGATPPSQTTPPISEQAGLGDLTVTAAGQQAIKDAAAAALAGAGGSLAGQVAGIGGTQAPSQPATDQQAGDLESQFDQALPAKPGAGDLTVTAAQQPRLDRIAAAVEALWGPNSAGDKRLEGLTSEEFAEAQRQYRQERENLINVEAANQQTGIGGAAAGAAGAGTGNTSPVVEGEQITVTGNLGNTVLPIGGPLVSTGFVNQPISQPGSTQTTDQAKEDVANDKGMSTMDYIRLALAAPNLINGIGGLLGAGGDNTRLTQERSPLSYTPLNRTQTAQPGIGGAPAFDVFTYGQNRPGAQQGEFTFFQPYDIKAAPQTYSPLTASEIYTQADVDAANNAIMSQYNSRLMDFNTYQDTLASQVASGAMTPAQAQVAAQQYAATLGAEAAPAMAEGGEVDDDMVKHLMAYSEGGGHRGPGKVSGIGSGQEDLIPAWLSDGEYVWSAQDVADLGDGSTDEGVRRLDKMRQMVRKNAGRKDVKKIAKPQPKLDKMLKAVGGPV